MATRVTNVYREDLVVPDTDIRVTRVFAEVITRDLDCRVTRVFAEHLMDTPIPPVPTASLLPIILTQNV